MQCNFSGITRFCREETGAVAVDWVVLSASVVGFGLATVIAIKTGATDLSADISGQLVSASVTGLGGAGFAAPAAESGQCQVAQGAGAYVPLVATAAEMQGLVQSLASGNDAVSLAGSYTGYALQAAGFMANGDYPRAAGFLDTVAAIEQALHCAGGTVADGAPSVQDLRAIYDAGTR